MSTVQERVTKQDSSSIPAFATKPHIWRLLVLVICLAVNIGINVGFLLFPTHEGGPYMPFLLFFVLDFVPYFVACFIVLKLKPQPGRWRFVELGLILVGALVLRAMLLSVNPYLSPDSWRYLWDARVTLLGYSPYATIPENPAFAHLRDTIYAHMAFRNTPTAYPPGAQAIYILSYLIAPSNLVVLKTIFMIFDLVTCAGLAWLLHRRGLDFARAIIYAWCPLPVIDFAIQGHLDVLTVSFMILAVICSLGNWRGSRALTGFLVAMATLTKFYPIVLLVVVMRRRDWVLLGTCFTTIVLAYVPYYILGHGQIFGFIGTYANEHTPNAGLVQHVMTWVRNMVGFDNITRLIWEYTLDILLVGGASLVVLSWRLNDDPDPSGRPNSVVRVMDWLLQRLCKILSFRPGLKRDIERAGEGLVLWLRDGHISMEAALLLLIGLVFVASSHVFPWYTTALLPWIAILLQPIWTRTKGWNAKALAVASAWYLPCFSVLHYFMDHGWSWNIYYAAVYDVVVAGIGVAILIAVHQKEKQRCLKNTIG